MSIDRRSFIHDLIININVGCADQYSGGATSAWAKNSHHVHLKIQSVVIKIDVHGEDGSDNNDCFDYEGGDFSDPDVDEVPDDIDEEGTKDENVYASLVENSS
ncbi:hypothetical protein PVK06_042563 [Gossypium arboreum]|uniref:Uncharacterized protein n=1 Tax=Gossypium arboreum TaxID=29729 RepID=A0ABR0MN53_GOSAR|nr:hypothetical protein PVK06_042563 [Gossypium arboreum]